MKIVCDNCATKYSIADEKVRGKVFKIRCKKCSHIIVVRGGADGSVEASRDAAPADGGFPGEEPQTIAARGGTPAAGVPASGGGASGDSVWHLVIDREQVGPLTPAEVRGKFANGEVDVETYAWREGFGDWLRLGSIEDFRDLGGAAPTGDENATRRTDSADLFAGAGGSDEAAAEAPSGDLFGGGGGGGAAQPSAFSSAPVPEGADVFAGGGGLFGAPSAAPARQARTSSPGFAASAAAEPAQSGGVDVRPMTGQRNENSVLFSLNNLQALATGGGGAKSSPSSEPRPGFANSQTEGSGLIDIRAMAASTLAASPSSPSSAGGKSDDLPGLGNAPVFSPMAAPILMPAAPSGPPKWMWAILGVGVMAVLGIVIVGFLLLTRKPVEPTVVAAAPATTVAPAAAAAGTAPAATAGTPAAGAAPAAAQPSAAVAANEPKSDDAKKHGAKTPRADKATKVAKNDAPAAKAETPPPAAPVAAAPPPRKSGKHDELDDLLNQGSKGGDDAPKPARKAAAAREEPSGGGADESLPDQLDKSAIVAGMSRVKPRVIGCFDQFKVPGTANVAITINGGGRVSTANVTGQFAGTPTGECVAKAAKSASFPKFKGAAQSIVYPYILR